MKNLDIQKLRTALMVSNTLNFSEAAYELNFTPSAISKQVTSLENDLGITLFKRHSRNGVSLTEDMQKILPTLQNVVYSFDEFEKVVRAVSQTPTFYIGMPVLFPSSITSSFISELVLRIPEVQVQILHHDNRELLKLLSLGKVDAVITVILGTEEDNPAFFGERNDEIEMIPIGTTPDVVYLNEKHPLAKKEKLCMRDVLKEPRDHFLFISTKPNAITQREQIFRRACRQYGVERQIHPVKLDTDIAFITLLRQIAANPHNVGFGPITMNGVLPGVVARECEDSIFPAKIIVCYRKQNHSRVMKAFLQVVEVLMEQRNESDSK